MSDKKYRVIIRDRKRSWSEDCEDPKEFDVKAYFQNAVDRFNEREEGKYGAQANLQELVSVDEIKPEKENVIAVWDISLDVDCPKCEEYFDILQIPDFWDGRTLDLGEHGTDRSRDIEIVCLKCGHAFKVDLEYCFRRGPDSCTF